MANASPNGDRVAVLDSSFAQVIAAARPINARVSEDSRLLDHPIETGQLITDYSIVMPIEIELSMIVGADDYRDTYQQIKTLYLNKQLLIVQTSTQNYTNMVLAQIPHEEKPELYDALPILLKFREIQIVPNPQTYVPADPAQSDTQALGQQNGYTITGVKTMQGTQTIPGTAYSSVPPQNTVTASGVQTLTGPQTINVPTNQDIPVSGVQTLTSQQAIGSTYAGGVPLGSQ